MSQHNVLSSLGAAVIPSWLQLAIVMSMTSRRRNGTLTVAPGLKGRDRNKPCGHAEHARVHDDGYHWPTQTPGKRKNCPQHQ